MEKVVRDKMTFVDRLYVFIFECNLNPDNYAAWKRNRKEFLNMLEYYYTVPMELYAVYEKDLDKLKG